MPSTDAVWFGSPLAVGVKNVGSVVAETRAIGGQHVTVFSRESALRRQILGTARGGRRRRQRLPDAAPCSSADAGPGRPDAVVALGLRLLPGHRHARC